MIPALIVPVLNRRDLLERMMASVDVDVDRFIIIDNGEAVGLVTLLPGAEDRFYRVIDLGHNIGVSAAWNLGMKVTPGADWWLIVNSDVEFGAGDLARLESTVNPGASALYCIADGMAAFALTSRALDDVGYFDENFHPAYDEDLDWRRRAFLAGIEVVSVPFTGTHVGSATIGSDPQLRARNGATHPANDAYYARKWGGRKQGGEQFTLPFGRGSHVGEWRLEPERLREQAWPRPARRE